MVLEAVISSQHVFTHVNQATSVVVIKNIDGYSRIACKDAIHHDIHLISIQVVIKWSTYAFGFVWKRDNTVTNI